MRWNFILAISLSLMTGCSTHPPPEPAPADAEEGKKEIFLSVEEYKPGDRNAMLGIENKTKDFLLSYDGPYVEFLTNGNWTEYTVDVPEMSNVQQARRVGPTLTSGWFVRVPPGHSSWRAYIHARLYPLKHSQTNHVEFTVWSKEVAR